MFGKKPQSIIYLSRNGLQIFTPEDQNIVQIPFKPDTVINLEVASTDSLFSQIQDGLSTNQIDPTTAILMLSEDILFTKKIGAKTSDARDEQVQEFLNDIPINPDLIVHKVFTFRGYRLAVATNVDFYLSVKRSFESLKWKILYVVPDVIFIRGNLAPQKILDVLNDRELLEMGDMLVTKVGLKKVNKKVSPLLIAFPAVGLAALIFFILYSKGVFTRKVNEDDRVLPVDQVKLTDVETVPANSAPDNTNVEQVEEQAEIEKKDIRVQILNGTGVSGLAGTVKSDLEKISYENIEVGNADTQDYQDTEVMYVSGISEVFINEIVSVLEKRFESVKSVEKSSTEQDKQDIIINTGVLK